MNDFNTLPAGREIDLMLAEALGYRIERHVTAFEKSREWRDNPANYPFIWDSARRPTLWLDKGLGQMPLKWCPSEDTILALEIAAEKLTRPFSLNCSTDWEFYYLPSPYMSGHYKATAGTPALAVVRGILATLTWGKS